MFNLPDKSKKQLATKNNKKSENQHTVSVPLPYVRGLSEKLTRVFLKHGVRTYHKPFNTLRAQLVNPKDVTPKEQKCGIIYHIKCDNCNNTYIGETARSFGTRFSEHG